MSFLIGWVAVTLWESYVQTPRFERSPQQITSPLHAAKSVKAAQRAPKRARQLIEQMLKEMQLGLKDTSYRMSDEWASLFGAKQSMVVNLQKLVATLAALPDESISGEKADPAAEEPALQAEEIAMFKAWLLNEETHAEQD